MRIQSNGQLRATPLGSSSDGNGHGRTEVGDAPIGELLRRLSGDGGHLVQQELQLAKTELRESAAKVVDAGVKVGTAAVLALPGMLAVTAGIVIGLGILIHSYWAASLIVGAVILVSVRMLTGRALAELKSGLAPVETARTLRDDANWTKDEAQQVKQHLTRPIHE